MKAQPSVSDLLSGVPRVGDPLSDLPRNDDEVIAKLHDYPAGTFRDAAIGLYRVRRLQGRSVLEAYEDTLRAACGMDKPGNPTPGLRNENPK